MDIKPTFTDLDRLVHTAYDLQTTDQNERSMELYTKAARTVEELGAVFTDSFIVEQVYTIYHNRAVLWYSLKRISDAFTDLKQCFAIKEAIPAEWRAVSHLLCARCHEEQKDYDSAFEEYELALTKFPSHVDTLIFRALLHHKQNNKMKAVEDCTRALALLHINSHTRSLRTFALIVRGDSYKFAYGLYQKQSMADYEKAMELDEARVSKYIGRGFTHKDPTGHCANLISEFASPLTIKPRGYLEYQKLPLAVPDPILPVPLPVSEPALQTPLKVEVPPSPKTVQPMSSLAETPKHRTPAVPLLSVSNLTSKLKWKESPENVQRTYRKWWTESTPTTDRTPKSTASFVKHMPLDLSDIATKRKYVRPWAGSKTERKVPERKSEVENQPPGKLLIPQRNVGTSLRRKDPDQEPHSGNKSARERMLEYSRTRKQEKEQAPVGLNLAVTETAKRETATTQSPSTSVPQRLPVLPKSQSSASVPSTSSVSKSSSQSSSSATVSAVSNGEEDRLNLNDLFSKLTPLSQKTVSQPNNFADKIAAVNDEFMMLIEERLLFSLAKYLRSRIPPECLMRLAKKAKAVSGDTSASTMLNDVSETSQTGMETSPEVSSNKFSRRRQMLLSEIPVDLSEVLLSIELNHPELKLSFEETDVANLVQFISWELNMKETSPPANVFARHRQSKTQKIPLLTESRILLEQSDSKEALSPSSPRVVSSRSPSSLAQGHVSDVVRHLRMSHVEESPYSQPVAPPGNVFARRRNRVQKSE
eukprot:ANDGO_08443.mRNA.1 hypothetical protein